MHKIWVLFEGGGVGGWFMRLLYMLFMVLVVKVMSLLSDKTTVVSQFV